MLQLHSPGTRPESHLTPCIPGGAAAPQDTVSLTAGNHQLYFPI